MTVRRIREPAVARSATRPPAWFNRLTLAVLRSPLHRLADSDVCALAFTGRRSGRRITVPVLYAARRDTLVVLVGDAADKQWWRNFRQPDPSRSAAADGRSARPRASLPDPTPCTPLPRAPTRSATGWNPGPATACSSSPRRLPDSVP
jgi:hypothetical protein